MAAAASLILLASIAAASYQRAHLAAARRLLLVELEPRLELAVARAAAAVDVDEPVRPIDVLAPLMHDGRVRRDDQDGLGRVPGVEGGDGAPQHRSRQGRDGLAEAHLIRQNQVAVGRQRRLLEGVVGPVVH